MDFENSAMKSIIDIADNVCYYWNTARQRLIRIDLASQDIPLNGKFNLEYLINQEIFKLHPHPAFDVTHISVKIEADIKCLIWGAYGLALVTLPPSSNNTEEEGAEIVASCMLVEEKTFAYNPNLLVLQAKWVGSSAPNVLCVLNNDGFIRFYQNRRVVGTVRVYRQPLPPRRPALFFEKKERELGETLAPVDFDFGPRIGKRRMMSLFIIGGTGNISYVIIKPLEESKSKQYLLQEGPYSLNRDCKGYGGSILVNKDIPTRLVVADRLGTINHYFLFPSTNPDEPYDFDACFMRGELTLKGTEIIRFNKRRRNVISSNTILAWEPESNTRYTFTHDHGVHVVTMRSTRALIIASQIKGKRKIDSSIKNIVVWKPNERMVEENSILGFSFTSPISNRFIFLFGNLDSLSLNLPLIFGRDFPINSGGPERREGYDENEVQNRVADVLKNKTNVPFLSTCKDLKGLELTSYGISTINKLSVEYMTPLKMLAKYLCDRIDKMKAISRDLEARLETYSENAQYFKSVLELMAELYEEIVENEEGLKKRWEEADHKMWESNPCITDDEKQWRKNLEAMSDECKKVNSQVTNLKSTLALKVMNSDNERGLGSSTVDHSFYGQEDVTEARQKITNHQDQINELTTVLRKISDSCQGKQ